MQQNEKFRISFFFFFTKLQAEDYANSAPQIYDFLKDVKLLEEKLEQFKSLLPERNFAQLAQLSISVRACV